MGEEQNYTWVQEGSNFYKVDDQGNKIFTTETPENMTGVYVAERNTGETVNDPNTKRTYYSVGDGYARNTDGYRLRAYGRRTRRDSIRAILSGRRNKDYANINNVTDAEKALYNVYGTHELFGRFFKNDGNLRRRALRNKSFLNELASNRYSSDENYRENDDIQTISMGTDKNAKKFANQLDNIIYPTLTKVVPGHFANSRLHRNKSRNNAQTVTRNSQDQSPHSKKRCKKCKEQQRLANAGKSQSTSTSTPTKTRPVKKSESKWIGRETYDIGAKYNTSYEYDQIPVIETLYAIPHQGSEKTIVEQQQTPPITTITSSTSSETVSTPVKKSLTRKKSLKPTKPKKPVTTTTTTKTTSKKITPPQSSSKKYKIYYDPDGNELRREIINEKMGGLLKYISK